MCTGNFIRNAAGHVVWSVDSMYAAPVDLHNVRLVACFGAKRGCVLQADVKSAYLQALLGGNATWLKIPKSLMHLFPQRARSMKEPVVRLIRARACWRRAAACSAAPSAAGGSAITSVASQQKASPRWVAPYMTRRRRRRSSGRTPTSVCIGDQPPRARPAPTPARARNLVVLRDRCADKPRSCPPTHLARQERQRWKDENESHLLFLASPITMHLTKDAWCHSSGLPAPLPHKSRRMTAVASTLWSTERRGMGRRCAQTRRSCLP